MFSNPLLLAGLLLPFFARAQYVPGFYKLAADDQQVHAGRLWTNGTELRVKKEDGSVTHLAATAVAYAKTAAKQVFVPAEGFQIPAGIKYVRMPTTLVELLDSGRVRLMRYEAVRTPLLRFDGSADNEGAVRVYLVQAADSARATTLPAYSLTNKSRRLREALTPYTTGRPDLLTVLNKNFLSEATIIAFFHALNSGQPFVKP